jgi:hypothetical protein
MATNDKIIRDRSNDDIQDRLQARISKKTEELANAGNENVAAARTRAQEFIDQWTNTALPDIPGDILPGFHICWLSTTSSYDTIDKRMALGYEPVKAVELGPKYDHLSKMDSGKFEGCVSCNEMILAKIPEELYQEAMKLMHFELPMEHQTNINNNLRNAAENSKGGKSLLEGGLLEMEKSKIDPGSLKF